MWTICKFLCVKFMDYLYDVVLIIGYQNHPFPYYYLCAEFAQFGHISLYLIKRRSYAIVIIIEECDKLQMIDIYVYNLLIKCWFWMNCTLIHINVQSNQRITVLIKLQNVSDVVGLRGSTVRYYGLFQIEKPAQR